MVYHAEDCVCEEDCICGLAIWMLADRRRSRRFAQAVACTIRERDNLRDDGVKTSCCACGLRLFERS